MSKRTRGAALGGGRGSSPMDRAADGLQASGKALGAMYEAARQMLPEVLLRADRALDLAERAVLVMEQHGGAHCTHCGQRVDLHDGGEACAGP